MAMRAAARPDLLAELVDIARRTFGFFPDDDHHLIGCPWVARLLEDLPANSRVLDIGAGLSALPLFFAVREAVVACVDSHPVTRNPPPSADWNEWGFFDYAQLHPKLNAYHCAVADFATTRNFDAIYSVAAIAHMPRAVRENALERCRELLRPGGALLLTLDLIPGTDFLWNMREGYEVESAEQHGRASHVSRHLVDLGFQIREFRTHRAAPTSRTDLLFASCIRGT